MSTDTEPSGPPSLTLAGPARERGRIHGEQLRETIARGLNLWFEHLAEVEPQSPRATIEDLVGSTRYLEAAERWTPLVVEEIRGIAEGANEMFETLFAYNLADEQYAALHARGDRCTTVGLRAEYADAPMSGQNMDIESWHDETKVVLHIQEEESGLEVLSFTLAGLVALCGVNSAGVSVWCNAVYQLASSPAGVPVVCISRTVLSQRSGAEAEAFVRRVPHACGQNFLVGSPDRVVSLECSARSVRQARPDGRAVWHTNHPISNADRSSEDDGASSVARDAFAGEHLARSTSVEDLQALLADRTVPVCKVNEAEGFGGHTVWAIVVEHTVPPRVHATAGPPSEAPWKLVRLSELEADR